MVADAGGPGVCPVGLMKTIGIGAVALATSISLSASAGQRQWYVAVEGGVNWTDAAVVGAALPLCGILGITACGPDYSIGAGWAAFASIGMPITDNFRLEGEIGRRSSVLGDRGDFTNTTAMLNGLLDIPVFGGMTLSLGAGAGMDWASTEQNTVSSLPNSDSGSGFAYQAIAELSYGLSDHVDVKLAYRYLATYGVDDLYANVRMNGAASDTAVARVNDASSSAITVGLRFAL